MNSSNKLTSILFKATGLATIIFWAIILSEKMMNDDYILLFLIISIIPISIVCSFTILITVMPFYWLEQNNLSNNEIFKKYFPYYSIVTFCICLYFIVSTNFESFVCAFFISAFFTLMQTWVLASKT